MGNLYSQLNTVIDKNLLPVTPSETTELKRKASPPTETIEEIPEAVSTGTSEYRGTEVPEVTDTIVPLPTLTEVREGLSTNTSVDLHTGLQRAVKLYRGEYYKLHGKEVTLKQILNEALLDHLTKKVKELNKQVS